MINPKTDLALLCQCQVLVVDMELDFALESLPGVGEIFYGFRINKPIDRILFPVCQRNAAFKME